MFDSSNEFFSAFINIYELHHSRQQSTSMSSISYTSIPKKQGISRNWECFD